MVEDKARRGEGKSAGRSGSPARRPIQTPAEREEETRQKYRKRNRDRRWAIGLVSVGAVIGLQHWLEHLSVISWPIDTTAQDFMIGYPAAGLLIVVGLIKLPA